MSDFTQDCANLRPGARIAFLLVLVVFCASFIQPVIATHITGAEITYECLNPAASQYRVTISVYRDCENGQAPFDNNITLYIFRGINNSLFTTRNIGLPSTGIQIIPASWDACTGQPINLCVEYVKYTTIVNLPPIFGGYNLAWARCCRNNIVTNIAPNQGITVLARVPGPEHALCNSSPVFNQLPPLFLCVGQPFSFNHAATDADGDSLVYRISNPFTGTNFNNQGATQFQPVVGGFGNQMGPPPYRNVNFLPGFNFTTPFAGGNFSIDPQSGFLTLTPTQTGVSVFAVSVLEYRNGILLSENKRDFQISVVACQPQGLTPVLNTPGLPANSGDTLRIDPLQNRCYTVTLQDPNPADVVSLFPVSAIFGIGGTLPPPFATLTTAGTNPVVGQVCWAPSCDYAGDTVRLIVGGRDVADCPGYNLVFDTVTAIVRQPARPALTHTGPNGSSAKVFNVNPNTNFCYSFFAADADTADVLEVTPISGPFQALGGAGPFATLAQSGLNPINGQVCWNIPCTAAGQTVTFVLRVRDVNLCNYTAFDTVILVIAPKPAFGASNDTSICLGETVRLSAFGGAGYNWTPQASLTNPNSPATFATPAQTTSFQVRIFDVFGCEVRDTITVEVRPLPLANAGPDQVRCPDSSVTLQASGGIAYSWTPAAGLSAVNIPNPTASPTAATQYVVRVTGANGCTASDSVLVGVFAAQAGASQAICFSQQTAQLMASALNPASFFWSPTAGLSDPSIANPVANPAVTTMYTVTITGQSGCVDTAQTTVLVRPLPPVDAGSDDAICLGESYQFTASGAATYQWAAMPGLLVSGPQASITPTSSAVYRVRGTDGFGCSQSDSVVLTVNPLPVANAGANTVKCGTTGIQLAATGGLSYQWAPATGLSNAFIADPIANPDSSTRYALTVTDANGCQDIDSVFVRAMYARAGADRQLCIFDTLTLNASGGIAFQWDPAPDLIGDNLPNPRVFPQVSQTYVVTVTDIGGCTDRYTVYVTVNPLPVTSATGTDPFVCASGGTRVIASGGVSYEWFPAQWFPQPDTAAPLAFPEYSGVPIDTTVWLFVQVTDANGCRQLDSLSQLVRKQPLISVTPDTVKCPGTTVSLRATGGVAYSWNPPAFLSTATGPEVIADPPVTTTYAVVVTAVWGCADTGYVRVIVMAPDAGSEQTICFGDTLILQGRGGVSYARDPPAFLSQPFVPDPRAFPVDTIDFVLTVTDSVGCIDTDTVRINVKPAPPADAGPDQAICFGDTASFAASGGLAYLWLDADSISQDNISSPQVWPGATRSYVVAVTGANQCVWNDTLTLTVNPLPVADAGPDLTKCGKDPIPIQGFGGVVFEWMPADGLSDPFRADPLAGPDSSTVYVLLVTDANGCQDTDTLFIRTMYAQAGPGGIICEGDSIQLQAAGGIAYLWSPAQWVSDSSNARPFAFPRITTEFIVTALDSSGCSDTSAVTIFVNAYPPAYAGPDTAVCVGDTLQLEAMGGLSYRWAASPFLSDLFSASPQAWPQGSTFFTVAVTDTNGCSLADSVFVTVNDLPQASAGADQTVCGRDSVTLQGSGGISYLWAPSIGLSDPQAPAPQAAPDSATTFVVQVTDSNGCTHTDSVRVSVLYALAGPDLQKCPEDTVSLFFGAVGGQPVARRYQPAPGWVPAGPDFVWVVADSTARYILEITDASGCVARDTVTVLVFPSPPAEAGADTSVCLFEAVTLSASGGISYLWRTDPDLIPDGPMQAVVSPQMDKYFWVTVTDGNGCRADDSVWVTVLPLPPVDAGRDTVICARSAALLEARGAVSYVWTPEASLSDPFSDFTLAAPDLTTRYVVTGVDERGCRNSDTVEVRVRDLPFLQTDTLRSICAGQEIWLRASGAERIVWFDNQAGDSVRVMPLDSRLYWAQPYNEGCPGDTVFIRVAVDRNLPIARFEPSPAQGFYPLDVQFENTSRFSAAFEWDFGDGGFSEASDPGYRYESPGEYPVRLIAMSELGCRDTFTYTFIDVWDFAIYYPNAFTPNGDGVNDNFYIVMNAIQEMRIDIFNQWGKIVYSSTDPNFRWDGRYQGIDQPEGVYVFHFQAVTFKGQEIRRGGDITLIR